MDVDRNSLLYWYLKINELLIPQPKTTILYIGHEMASYHFFESGSVEAWQGKIEETAAKIGYPLFLRTDQASHKHNWKKAAYVESKDELMSHVRDTLEFNYLADMMGLDCVALVFREYIPMDSKYTAFYGDMPVNPERRYFIKDGKILCHHQYWIEDAIRNPSVENWKELSAEMNHESPEEIELLSGYVLQVAKLFEGFWSVDFCKAKDGQYYLIDMALGEKSWHEKSCVNSALTGVI